MTSVSTSRFVLGAVVFASAATLGAFAFAQSSTRGLDTTTGAAGSDQQWISTAQSAAPRGVSANAAIAVAEGGKFRTIKEGSNGWTCLPSFPTATSSSGSAGTSGTFSNAAMSGKPICVDGNGFEWIRAFVDQKEPPANKISAAYMMQGFSGSATNPAASTSSGSTAATEDTITVGPHVMVLGGKSLRDNLASIQGDESATRSGRSAAGGMFGSSGEESGARSGRSAASGRNIDASKPFVMWQGTPYEHLMIPIQ